MALCAQSTLTVALHIYNCASHYHYALQLIHVGNHLSSMSLPHAAAAAQCTQIIEVNRIRFV